MNDGSSHTGGSSASLLHNDLCHMYVQLLMDQILQFVFRE